ncbi:hypothetical protein [Pseudomonas sp. SLFW]|uniref:hypothetical protein n=1 Tax=Pseudomonas sp. SLFW TaxID=2683259 RepID=UPI0014126A45|nr:hypothetical protein [Pseudomonas sp. SLFW]NBB09001.1 hypothetical protein [Pseudomonas sp. SLFW]
MQPTLPPEDDGQIVMQRLTPDQFDVVLGSHPAKRKLPPAKHTWPLSSVLICLALVMAILYLVAQMFHTQKPAPMPVATLPAADVIEAPEPEAQTPEIRTTEQVVYVAPKLDTTQPATSKPLDDCMKQGNVIDRDVINCRFGDIQPTDYNAPRPQGMVSDRYMAQYKATAAKPQAETGRRYEVAGVLIREVDGRNRYEARYRIYNNHVENNSVCMNFKADSVEYRECRRAAAPYFKDMCSDWTKRAAKDRDEKNKLAQEQFCEAANTYRP